MWRIYISIIVKLSLLLMRGGQFVFDKNILLHMFYN